MRLSVLSENRRFLARGAAIFLVGGLAAGCSSDVVRFQDGFYTGAMPTQQEIAAAPAAQQPYPSDSYDATAPALDDTFTGSIPKAATPAAARSNSQVQRAALAPLPRSNNVRRPVAPNTSRLPAMNSQAVLGQQAPRRPAAAVGVLARAPSAPARARVDRTVTNSTPRATAAQPQQPMPPSLAQGRALAPQPSPIATQQPMPPRLAQRRPSAALAPLPRSSSAPHSQAPAHVDRTVTNTVASSPSAAPTPAQPQGWTRTGGTQVTLRQGETLYNLSRRFGVPVREIMKANGISNPASVHAGQTIVIPTYVYSSRAPVSAPDNNPNTASARSSRGLQAIPLPGEVPVPTSAPRSKLAVLPQKPQVKERQSAAATSQQTGNASVAASGSTYTVVSGDTLYGIARKTGTSVAALKSANGLTNGSIRIGQVLQLSGSADAPGQTRTVSAPTPAKPKVAFTAPPQGVDNMVTGTTGPARNSGSTGKGPRNAAKLPSYTPPNKETSVAKAEPKKTDSAPMRWPAQGRIISAFGSKSGGKINDGIDIAVPSGTPVKAAESGVVIYAGDGLKEFGNTVLVRHSGGLVTVYGHNSKLLVSRGDKVQRGQDIARSGMSGSAETPKLHFEVRKNSAPADPTRFLGNG